MFGKKFQLANEDGNFPTEEDRGILAQDDTVFIIYFKEKIVIYFKVQDEIRFENWSDIVNSANSNDPDYYPSDESDEFIPPNKNIQHLDKLNESIQTERSNAHEAQKKQTSKMLEVSNKKLYYIQFKNNFYLLTLDTLQLM
jgi:hypothetical protein